MVDALVMIELASGIERDPLDLGHLRPIYIEGVIGQLKHHPDRPVGEHAGVYEVTGHPERVFGPQSAAAIAAGIAGGIEVGTVAAIHVIVIDHVPLVDHHPRVAL